jgi:hypothetical protein
MHCMHLVLQAHGVRCNVVGMSQGARWTLVQSSCFGLFAKHGAVDGPPVRHEWQMGTASVILSPILLVPW